MKGEGKEGMGGTRRSILRRKTAETEILVDLDLDGSGQGSSREDLVRIYTGLGFLDHLLASLAFHAGWRLELLCRGDLGVDDHHSAEDCALVLGEALSRCLERGGRTVRFASAYAPLDEALSRVVVDLSGRPFAVVDLGLETAMVGDLAFENVSHFFQSLASSARMTVHVDLIRGGNAHHCAESAFKALALALREACALRDKIDTSPRGAEASGKGAVASGKGAVVLEELDRSGFDDLAMGLAERSDRASRKATGGMK